MFDTVIIEDPILRGLIVGMLMAAPVGAVGVMCIKRALSDGWRRALAVGLGSACVDAIFGAVAGLGLTYIATFVTDHQRSIGLLGGLIVIGVGIATYFSPIKTEDNGPVVGRKRRDFAAGFMLSIANPATMLGAIGLFAALGQVDPVTAPQSAVALISAVFAGSLAWWVFLISMARMFRHKFVPERLQMMNKIEGALISLFGIVLVIIVLSHALSL
ncbi:MAG: LysE family transporter [Rhodospirillaceae bacterium]|nr:LysE family transporter [Rhodospirillaceae bacterium]